MFHIFWGPPDSTDPPGSPDLQESPEQKTLTVFTTERGGGEDEEDRGGLQYDDQIV